MGKNAKIIDEKGMVYDIETGEIVADKDDMYLIKGSKRRIVKKKSLEYLKSTKTDNRPFVKLYIDDLLYYVNTKNIGTSELKVFLYLCKHIKSGSNFVTDRSGNGITNKDIIYEVEMDKYRVSKYIKKLKQYNMITGNSGNYYVNPCIINKSKLTYNSTIEMFKKGD